MKRIYSILLTCLIPLGLTVGCSDFLDVKPTDSITAEALFSSESGIQAYLATLYHEMPIEDFAFMPSASNGDYPEKGFNYNIGDSNNNGNFEWTNTDDAIGSQGDNIIGTGSYRYWDDAYKLNNHINAFIGYIDGLTSVSSESKKALYGQAWFARAYTYFALARRYGGVPIITKVGDLNDSTTIFIPRSKEVATWDWVLECCDSAIAYLGTNGGNRQATKWAALALKSRAALHAASVSKYWDDDPLSGKAVDEGLVGGFTDETTRRYYQACVDASEEIIKSGAFKLAGYNGTPADREKVAETYRKMFEDPSSANEEIIFLKGFDKEGVGYGSNQDNWGNPRQTSGAWPHPGRFNPTLDFVDNFESYDNEGVSAPIVTTTDGSLDYNGYQSSKTYLEFDHPYDIFANKDQRLWGTVILPGTQWKDVTIVIQAGIIKTNGEAVIEPSDRTIHETVGGKDYYVYGAEGMGSYSGFDTEGGNYTRTGFGFKKFLNTSYVPKLGWNYSTTDWIEMRYAEVLLNYAEAVAESGLGDPTLAKTCLNETRHRAGFVKEIPLTLENVLRERRAELSFEQTRAWDLIRRREFDDKFNNTRRTALAPVLDLRTMKYIFVRKYARNCNGKTLPDQAYYHSIPGTGSNGLVQNPQY